VYHRYRSTQLAPAIFVQQQRQIVFNAFRHITIVDRQADAALLDEPADLQQAGAAAIALKCIGNIGQG
jgi:hypothetical protein